MDLNSESVEITKLSLWLKTANRQEKLTYLEDNIKVGNSLIDDPEIAGNLAFDWNAEFSEIMQNGGFDVIVGNPPYVFARNQGFTDHEKTYYYKKYEQAHYQINTYALFTEKAFKLLRENGYKGYIIPNTWLTISSFKEFRNFILEKTSNTKIINIFDQVFSDASVDCCILLYKKGKGRNLLSKGVLSAQTLSEAECEKSFLEKDDYIINLSLNQKSEKLLEKINKSSDLLGDLALVTTGLKAYQVGKGKPAQIEEIKSSRAFHSHEKIDNTYIKYLEGRDVKRYALEWSGEWLSYGDWLAEPRKSVDFSSARILVRQIPSKPPYSIEAIYISEPYLNDINSMVIQADKAVLYPILGLINSRLTTWWFINSFDKFQRKTFPQFKVNELKKFPIFKLKTPEKALLTQFVQSLIEAKKDLIQSSEKFIKLLNVEFKIENTSSKLKNWVDLNVSEFVAEIEKSIKPAKLSLSQKSEWMGHFENEKAKALEIKNKINQTNHDIDHMVYKLYELTPEEIELVEKAI